MQAYFRLFHKEEECNYFSDSLHVICVVATSSSSDSSPLISLLFLYLTYCNLARDVQYVWMDGESPAFLKSFTLSYIPKSTCQIFSELICFFCWPVCKILHVMKLLSTAAVVGGILSIETTTFDNFELQHTPFHQVASITEADFSKKAFLKKPLYCDILPVQLSLQLNVQYQIFLLVPYQ